MAHINSRKDYGAYGKKNLLNKRTGGTRLHTGKAASTLAAEARKKMSNKVKAKMNAQRAIGAAMPKSFPVRKEAKPRAAGKKRAVAKVVGSRGT
jgi:hypothetical protein